MNDAQRLLVIIALVVIGVVLGWLMLDWGTCCYPILTFYERPRGPYVSDTVGIYAHFGIPPVLAILFGVVLPVCLFAFAIFLALGRRKT